MTLEVYKSRPQPFRWRLRARNGQVVATSGESFVSKRNARLAGLRVIASVQGNAVTVKG